MKEVLYLNHECDKLVLKAFHIHDRDNQFTGITKIERHAKYADVPTRTIHYAFHGCVYTKLEDAVNEYRKIGRQVIYGGR